jgi:Na+/H+ antiporter NhaD/arsenite permease-like protein
MFLKIKLMATLIIAIFIAGYSAIALEHTLKVDKAAIALITGVLCWTVYIFYTPDKDLVNEELTHSLGELSGILFFLLGAMTVVELIDAYKGFDIITSRINETRKGRLLWMIALITFFLSAILDNLTATIVMISLLRKIMRAEKNRLFYAGIIVIAANAGGAWSPIGDVTTTMLWIGKQITSVNIMVRLILPSLACLAAPLIYLSFRIKGNTLKPQAKHDDGSHGIPQKQRNIIFFSGLFVLMMVPVFKTVTHLPPYMGVLFGLGVLWIVTEVIRGGIPEEEKHVLSVVYALRKIDSPSILFFLGILASVAALQATGILASLASWLNANIANEKVIVVSIGLLSSIVDNVPLVAAVQGMYPLSHYPTDHSFWEFLAYCSGTGGSTLIIGSAAGVAAMGMEKINFFWYIKKISLLALLGYFAGIFVYILQEKLFY